MSELDLRGLRCPWPALRLARALREGLALPCTVRADDPRAGVELTTLAENHGLTLSWRNSTEYELHASH